MDFRVFKRCRRENSYRKVVTSTLFTQQKKWSDIGSTQFYQNFFQQLNRQRTLEQDQLLLRFQLASSILSPAECLNRNFKYLLLFWIVTVILTRAISAIYLVDKFWKTLLNGRWTSSEGQGIAFYEFKDIPDEKEFKATYRKALNELPLELQQIPLSMKQMPLLGWIWSCSKKLEGNLIKAIGQMLFNSLTRRRTRGSTWATAE